MVNTTMEAMAEAALSKGYQYVAITDHSESLPIANGLSVERLRQNIAEARRLSEKMIPFRVLIGSEVEIDENGKLDYPSDVLRELDLVVGAVHSRFKMSEMEMTNRIITAMSNDQLTILAHPTGRSDRAAGTVPGQHRPGHGRGQGERGVSWRSTRSRNVWT